MGVLGEVREVRVWRRRLAGRPRKKWSDCVMEDMLGVEKHVVEDQLLWRVVITHLAPF